jgi:hypothetical protein
MSKKSFTFDNRRSGAQSVVSRIDKFMVSQGIEERGGRMEAVASIKKLSDHSSLTITIWGHHPPPNNPTRFFNTTVLNQEKGKMELLNAWAGDTARPSTGQDWAEWFEEAMERVANRNKWLAKEKRRAQGARVKSCTKKMQLEELQLQRDPTNSEVRGIFSDTQSQLAKEFQASMARNRHLNSANWLRYNDTCSKTFFDFHCIGKKKALMKELETDSRTISGQQDLTHYVTSFYARLYTSNTGTPGIAKAQDLCWQNVPGMVTDDTSTSLVNILSLEEMGRTIQLLPKGKTSGHNDIPMGFFHECEQGIAPDLLQTFMVLLSESETSAYINKGVITFIPKSEDHTRLNNW